MDIQLILLLLIVVIVAVVAGNIISNFIHKKDKTDLVVEGKGDSRIRQKSDVFRPPRKKN